MGLSFYALVTASPKKDSMWFPLPPHPISTLKCLYQYPFLGPNCNMASKTLCFHAHTVFFFPFCHCTGLSLGRLFESLPLTLFLQSVLCGTRKEVFIKLQNRVVAYSGCPILGFRHMHEFHLISAPNTVQVTNQPIHSCFLTD